MSEFLKMVAQAEKELEPKLKEEIPSQQILWIKTGLIGILEKRNPKKYFTVKCGEKFGISELLVNQLMKYCYERGVESGKYSNIDYKKDYEDLVKKVKYLAELVE